MGYRSLSIFLYFLHNYHRIRMVSVVLPKKLIIIIWYFVLQQRTEVPFKRIRIYINIYIYIPVYIAVAGLRGINHWHEALDRYKIYTPKKHSVLFLLYTASMKSPQFSRRVRNIFGGD